MNAPYDRWVRRWEATLAACRQLAGDARELRIGPPATKAEVEAVEHELGRELPPEFRRVLTEFSADVELRWFLPDGFPLPQPLREIFSGECWWRLSLLVDMEAGRKGWVDSCFPNPDDAYDRVWHGKLGFLEVGNGDLLSLDVAASPASVVYLSHDDGEGHGYHLGSDFIDFIDRWSLLGCPGGEDWQMLPFISGPTSGLNPDGPNAVLWRETLGVTFD